MHVVNACLCPDDLCCVASNASLSPLDFQVSRREVLAAVVLFFGFSQDLVVTRSAVCRRLQVVVLHGQKSSRTIS